MPLVQYYAYSSGAGAGVTFTGPNLDQDTAGQVMGNLAINPPPPPTVTQSVAHGFLTGLEDVTGVGAVVNALTTPPPPPPQTFAWQAVTNTGPVLNGSAAIDPVYGALTNSGPVTLPNGNGLGTLNNIGNTPSLVTPDWTVSYGYFGASSNLGGLTPNNQAYAYVTPNHGTWMGTLAQQNPQVNNTPFNHFVLAGAHDSGMCFLQTAQMTSMVQQLGSAIAGPLYQMSPCLGTTAFIAALQAGGQALGEQAILNAAFTQKDSITTLLNLGVRYFDFRPGYCYMLSPADGIFHQHAVIPGYPFTGFLTELFNWLANNKSEIVVVSLANNGFQNSAAMTPTYATLYGTVNQINNGRVVTGNQANLGSTYGQLIASNTRLLFLNNIDSNDPNYANPYDSYSNSYETTTAGPILQALGSMNAAGFAGLPNPPTPPPHAFTLLQLQGTAQGAGSSAQIGFNAISTSANASPLMSTKPSFDFQTYPWALANVHNNLDFVAGGAPLPTKSLVVLLNDFCDNALVDVGIQITMQRVNNTP